MKSVIIVGLIAGFIAGIVQAVLDISGIWELFAPGWLSFPVSIQHTVLFRAIWFSFWGIIVGGLYGFFYDYIPSKGVKKGLIFGLIIWIAVAIYPATINYGYGAGEYFIPKTFTLFISQCVVYGSLIGILYKKE
jgi:hypothetical protein